MQSGKLLPENRPGQWRHHVRYGEPTLPSLSCLGTWQWGLYQSLRQRSISEDNSCYKRRTPKSTLKEGDAHKSMWLGNHGSSWDAGHMKDRHSPIPIAQVYWRLYRVMKDETHLVSFSCSSLPKGLVACILGQENSTLKTGLWKAEKSSHCLPMDFSMVSSWTGFLLWLSFW